MRRIALLLGLLAALAAPSIPSANAGIIWSYDSGTVAAGAAIDSTVLRTDAPDVITCFVTNADGAATRAFTVTFYAGDATTAVGTPTAITVAISSKTYVNISPTGTANGGGSAISAKPTKYMRFQLAAAGASAGRIYCIGG
jgi:hypothetical protein